MPKTYLVAGVSIFVIAAILGSILIVKSNLPENKIGLEQPSGITPPVQNPTDLPNVSVTSSVQTTNTKTGEIELTISSPTDKSVISSQTVTVKGKTKPLADVAVNDQEKKADGSGNFSAIITLEEGENSIFVLVSDEDGNNAEKELTVTYQPEDK